MDDRMYKTGLLLLTQPLHIAEAQTGHVLNHVMKKIKDRLYVHLLPSVSANLVKSAVTGQVVVPCHLSTLKLITNYYTDTSGFCHKNQQLLSNKFDLRILLGNISNKKKVIEPQTLSSPCDIIFLDKRYDDVDTDHFKRYVMCNLLNKIQGKTDILVETVPHCIEENPKIPLELQQTYDIACVGGTFDRIHMGHKIILSHTCLLGEKSVTIGVTDGPMLEKKVLKELIEPTATRISKVTDLLQDIKPNIEHKVVPITDPFGPSIEDPEIQVGVVSEETLKGGHLVNEKRIERGMKPWVIHTISIVADSCHSEYEENKISSSSGRKRLLGTLLRPPQFSSTSLLPKSPYVIGLTGGIASGKTSVCQRLQDLGAAVVDCDKLGHKAYVKGTDACDKIVAAFGQEVVGDDGEINRKVLGPKVFAAKTELEKLNNIVWPAIAELAKAEIEKYREQGKSVVLLDAAVLLEAGWDSMVHEVWTAFVPRDEAVKRIMKRNNLPEEEAIRRIESQLSNTERLAKANVAVCTLWEYEYTQEQVETAWKLLQQRLTEST